jgi:hypothetical protein
MARRKQSTFQRLSLDRLNRKQRRDLGRRLESTDPGLSIVHSNAGGIDVGNESHFVPGPKIWFDWRSGCRHARSTQWRCKPPECTGSGCTTSWCSMVFRW